MGSLLNNSPSFNKTPFSSKLRVASPNKHTMHTTEKSQNSKTTLMVAAWLGLLSNKSLFARS